MIGRLGLHYLPNHGERSSAAEVARLHLCVLYRQQRIRASIPPPPLDLGQHPPTREVSSSNLTTLCTPSSTGNDRGARLSSSGRSKSMSSPSRSSFTMHSYPYIETDGYDSGVSPSLPNELGLTYSHLWTIFSSAHI